MRTEWYLLNVAFDWFFFETSITSNLVHELNLTTHQFALLLIKIHECIKCTSWTLTYLNLNCIDLWAI